MKKCCFSGYSTFNLSNANPDYQNLKKTIKFVIKNLLFQGYAYYLCGFDQGTDLYFAESLCELKASYPELRLESVIPYENQGESWPDNERERYYNLLAKCDKETILNTQYKNGCVIERNKLMIDHSEVLLVIFDGELSLTMQAIQYAKKSSKNIICLDPKDCTIHYLNLASWESTQKFKLNAILNNDCTVEYIKNSRL